MVGRSAYIFRARTILHESNYAGIPLKASQYYINICVRIFLLTFIRGKATTDSEVAFIAMGVLKRVMRRAVTQAMKEKAFMEKSYKK